MFWLEDRTLVVPASDWPEPAAVSSSGTGRAIARSRSAWPDRDGPTRAGRSPVSSAGLGAHEVLEEIAHALVGAALQERLADVAQADAERLAVEGRAGQGSADRDADAQPFEPPVEPFLSAEHPGCHGHPRPHRQGAVEADGALQLDPGVAAERDRQAALVHAAVGDGQPDRLVQVECLRAILA